MRTFLISFNITYSENAHHYGVKSIPVELQENEYRTDVQTAEELGELISGAQYSIQKQLRGSFDKITLASVVEI